MHPLKLEPLPDGLVKVQNLVEHRARVVRVPGVVDAPSLHY